MPIPSNGENLQKVSAKNIIYQTVCEWIITGVLQPGEKILDSELARHFNVSRTPVREAIQILERQKLIHVVPGRATVVAELDLADSEKCYRTLAELQGLAAELAAEQITEEELTELERVLTAFEEACENGDESSAITNDGRFHEIIVQASHNEYLEEFSHIMLLHIQRIKYHYFQSNRFRKTSAIHHRQILESLHRRDGQKAREQLRSHWLYAMERSIHDIAEKLKKQKKEETAD